MQKIKQFIESEKGKDVLIVLIVILVGMGSFELGRLSKGNQGSGIKIEYTNQSENQSANALSATESANSISQTIQNSNSTMPTQAAGKTFFASSRGSKYYPLGCSAGKSIKQENRVYFSTREEAEKAGYELSSSCR